VCSGAGGCFAGRGAWQYWTYEVQVINSRTNATLTLSAAQGTRVTVTGLLAGNVYGVRVRACSAAGCGPWSNNFTAQTLPSGTERITSSTDSASVAWFVCQGLTQILVDEF